jgi:hypothetical protein
VFSVAEKNGERRRNLKGGRVAHQVINYILKMYLNLSVILSVKMTCHCIS